MDKAYNRINWQNQPSTATALGATNLNKIDAAVNIIDDRVVNLDTTKFPRSEALSMIADWSMDLSTGVITVTLKDGTVKTYDTALEKVPISGVIDTDTNELVFTNSDGTTTRVDLAKLITQYEFVDTDTIGFVIGADGKVSCFVKDGSITGAKLEVNFLANCQLAALTATSHASLSKRYAVGGVEEGDATDNAKYYKEQAQYYKEQAQAIVGIDIATEEKAGLIKSGVDINIDPLTGGVTIPHKNDNVASEAGIHGLRYWLEKLEYFDGTYWSEVSASDKGSPPGNVINITIASSSSSITLKWSDPNDVIVDGVTLVKWQGTKLVRKAGSYPTSITDGVVLLDNLIHNAYSVVGFTDSGLTVGTTYYYQLFPYSDTGAVNTNETNRISATSITYRVMTVNIDLTNSNPATCCTYADDAVGMTAGSSAWDEFFGHKPCLFKDGVVICYLNPNDFTKDVDGITVDITSGNAGDVMIEFPRRGLTINTVGTTLTVKMTDNPSDENFEYNAHMRGATPKDKFYLGAYKGYGLSSKLRSLSGKIPTVSLTIGQFRTLAQANGIGYEQSAFYQLMFRQGMYLLRNKNLGSQTVVGRGYVDGNSSPIATGGTNTKGANFGETTGKLQMKLFGIEDFWGNVWEYSDGFFTNSTSYMLTATDGFNDLGTNYTNQGQGTNISSGNYISKPQGTTKTGFIAKEVSGSSTTYFCDYGALIASSIAIFGGDYVDASMAGAFRFFATLPTSFSGANVGARLMYL